jgi:hypothetical protein
MTVSDLEDRMSAREYLDWIEYFSLDPNEIDPGDMTIEEIGLAAGAG